MVMAEMRGGDLLSRIVDKEVYTEREARGVCKILFEAVLYCHQKRVAHRDIKPENLLLVDEHDDTNIKLADFGFAKKVTGDLSLSTLCGTAQYVAPEILDFQVEGYDERCDMWSVGVVTYILLGKFLRFCVSSSSVFFRSTACKILMVFFASIVLLTMSSYT